MRKQIRRLCALALAISLVLSIHIPATAASGISRNKEMMLAVLSEIGVITVDEEKGFDASASVSRAEFCEYVGKAIQAVPRFDVQYYNDVPRDYEQAGYINVLADHGIVSFNDARIFEPERPIRYAEACKMLLCAMGYGDYALSQGEQMSNWTNGAAEAGISLAIGDPDAVTAGEAMEMLFMAMSEPVMVKSFGDGSMKVDEGSNLFAAYHHIYFARGVVEATYGAYLERYSMPQPGEAIIDGTRYWTEFELSGLLGSYVEYVYRWDKSESEGTVIYARRLNDANVMTVRSDLVEKFDERTGTLSYFTNQDAANAKKQTVEKNYQIIYNGAPFSGTVTAAIKGFAEETRRGSVTLVDSDRNGRFDVVIVKNYEPFPNATIDTLNQKIYGGFEKQSVSFEDSDVVRLYGADGVEKELADYSGVVLDIARSEKDEIIEIILSGETSDLTAKSIRADKNEVTAADGTVYRFDPRVMTDYAESWTSQGAQKAYLDAFGYVVRLEAVKDEEFAVGYLVIGESYKEGLREKGVRLKIYTRAGKIENYEFAERIRIDGVSYNMKKEADLAVTALPGIKSYTENGERVFRISPQVIRYKLSEEKEITALDSTNLTEGVEDKNNSLMIRHQGAGLMNSNRLGLDTYWSAANTAVFTIPSLNDAGEVYKNGMWQAAEAKDFSTSASLTFDHTYTCDTYNYSDTDQYVDVLVIVQQSSILTSNALLYTGTGAVWDEAEGSTLTTVECIKGGAETSYKLSAGAESRLTRQGLRYGDMFYITLDGSGQYATDIKKIFDAESMTFKNSGNPYWYYGSYSPYSNWAYRTGEDDRYNLTKMYVLKKRNGAVFGSYEESELAEDDYEEIMNIGSIPVTVVYPDLERTEKGSFNSILSYEEAGGDASLILIEHRVQSAISVIIYK